MPKSEQGKVLFVLISFSTNMSCNNLLGIFLVEFFKMKGICSVVKSDMFTAKNLDDNTAL